MLFIVQEINCAVKAETEKIAGKQLQPENYCSTVVIEDVSLPDVVQETALTSQGRLLIKSRIAKEGEGI